MAPNQLELAQRKNEWFHGLTIPQGMWAIIRVDGRSFSNLTKNMGYEKPFDQSFSTMMQSTALDLFVDLDGVYAYTQSDEISVVLPPDYDLFNRSVEKLVSLSAARASVRFCAYAKVSDAVFDSRIWVGASLSDVIDYMQWRQADAARNALNGWCHWTLIKKGLTSRQANSHLLNMTRGAKHDLLMKHDINFNDLPMWQRRGIGMWWVAYEKEGYNPITDEVVNALRRKIHVKLKLPMKDMYSALIIDVISGMYKGDEDYGTES